MVLLEDNMIPASSDFVPYPEMLSCSHRTSRWSETLMIQQLVSVYKAMKNADAAELESI